MSSERSSKQPNLAKRHGLRQSSGALAGDGIQIGGFFNPTGLADLSRQNPMKAEIRLGALEPDFSRRNQMKADESG